jgi:hypothetical protein
MILHEQGINEGIIYCTYVNSDSCGDSFRAYMQLYKHNETFLAQYVFSKCRRTNKEYNRLRYLIATKTRNL